MIIELFFFFILLTILKTVLLTHAFAEKLLCLLYQGSRCLQMSFGYRLVPL